MKTLSTVDVEMQVDCARKEKRNVLIDLYEETGVSRMLFNARQNCSARSTHRPEPSLAEVSCEPC